MTPKEKYKDIVVHGIKKYYILLGLDTEKIVITTYLTIYEMAYRIKHPKLGMGILICYAKGSLYVRIFGKSEKYGICIETEIDKEKIEHDLIRIMGNLHEKF